MALELTDTSQHQMNGRLGSTPIQKKPQKLFSDEVY